MPSENSCKGELPDFNDLDFQQDAERWVELYRESLIKYIHRHIKDHHAAEDLCQEALFRAYRAKDTLESPEKIRSWLYSIAYHVTVDWLRHESSRKRLSKVFKKNYSAPEPITGVDTIMMVKEKKTRMKQEVDSLWQIVEKFPLIYREVFELRYREWFSIRQISMQTGLPEGNVKVRLYRARQMLLKALDHKNETKIQTKYE